MEEAEKVVNEVVDVPGFKIERAAAGPDEAHIENWVHHVVDPIVPPEEPVPASVAVTDSEVEVYLSAQPKGVILYLKVNRGHAFAHHGQFKSKLWCARPSRFYHIEEHRDLGGDESDWFNWYSVNPWNDYMTRTIRLDFNMPTTDPRFYTPTFFVWHFMIDWPRANNGWVEVPILFGEDPNRKKYMMLDGRTHGMSFGFRCNPKGLPQWVNHS